MSAPISTTSIPHLLATNITASTRSAKLPDPEKVDLAQTISEVTLRTQITGASMLTLDVIDPDGVLLRAGFLDTNSDGMLDAIEVEFPSGSGSFWRLACVDWTTDLTGPNLTLTFEDRIVAYLRDHWGPKTVAPGTTTRAQFVKSLVDEVGRSGSVPKIRFVCPSINVIQPVEVTTDTGTTVVQTPSGQRTKTAKANKSRAVHPDAAISIAGQSPNADQIHNINTLLGEAELLKAGHIACLALLYAAIGETRIGATSGTYKPNSAGYWGVLQGSVKTWSDPHDVAGMASAFLKGGQGFQAGGAMALSRTVPDPIEIAVRVEVPSIWPDNAYARQAGSGNFLAEAKAILESYGGAALGSQGPTGVPLSDIGQLARGTTDDPDEDSWSCINRLAQQVNWSVFSNADYLYYMDGPDLIAQRPALYLDCIADKASIAHLTGTFDNTTYLRSAGDKKQRRPLSKLATPSEVRLDLVCDLDAYRAGDVFVLRQAGPLNGRWIVSDATRRCMSDTFTSFTLVPPTRPTAEPQGEAGPVADPTNPSGGTASGNPTGPAGAKGLTTFDGHPVASWIVTVLKWARANGWPGKVNSGWRSDSDQLAAASHYAAQLGKPVSAVYPNGPLASNHCKKDYPGGAVDVSEPEQLAAALLNYKEKPTLVWGGQVIEDAVHFSSTGH